MTDEQKKGATLEAIEQAFAEWKKLGGYAFSKEQWDQMFWEWHFQDPADIVTPYERNKPVKSPYDVVCGWMDYDLDVYYEIARGNPDTVDEEDWRLEIPVSEAENIQATQKQFHEWVTETTDKWVKYFDTPRDNPNFQI